MSWMILSAQQRSTNTKRRIVETQRHMAVHGPSNRKVNPNAYQDVELPAAVLLSASYSG